MNLFQGLSVTTHVVAVCLLVLFMWCMITRIARLPRLLAVSGCSGSIWMHVSATHETNAIATVLGAAQPERPEHEHVFLLI
jgi:hypothetical protein